MPKFELNEYGQGRELAIVPEDGDMRIDSIGDLQQYTSVSNSWMRIDNIPRLISRVNILESDFTELENWKFEQELKIQDSVKAVELEAQYSDLKAAGDNVRELENAGKMAREYMRRVEETINIARQSYLAMVEDTKLKQKTFDILNTEVPGTKEDIPF